MSKAQRACHTCVITALLQPRRQGRDLWGPGRTRAGGMHRVSGGADCIRALPGSLRSNLHLKICRFSRPDSQPSCRAQRGRGTSAPGSRPGLVREARHPVYKRAAHARLRAVRCELRAEDERKRGLSSSGGVEGSGTSPTDVDRLLSSPGELG